MRIIWWSTRGNPIWNRCEDGVRKYIGRIASSPPYRLKYDTFGHCALVQSITKFFFLPLSFLSFLSYFSPISPFDEGRRASIVSLQRKLRGSYRSYDPYLLPDVPRQFWTVAANELFVFSFSFSSNRSLSLITSIPNNSLTPQSSLYIHVHS